MTSRPLEQLLEELIVKPITITPSLKENISVYQHTFNIYPFTIPQEIDISNYPKRSICEEPNDPNTKSTDPNIIYVNPNKYYQTLSEFNQQYREV